MCILDIVPAADAGKIKESLHIMEWAMVLVIILSIFLALFLVLAIVLVVMLIKVTRQIKTITRTAERTALKFEGAAENITKFSSPIMIAKMVSSFIKKNK